MPQRRRSAMRDARVRRTEQSRLAAGGHAAVDDRRSAGRAERYRAEAARRQESAAAWAGRAAGNASGTAVIRTRVAAAPNSCFGIGG